MESVISKKYNLPGLIRFALPSICMMIIMSLYTVVDGIFVANILGDTALSAINIVYPAMSVSLAISIMIATGGAAIVSRLFGEEKEEKAREIFTMLAVCLTVFSTVFTTFVYVFSEKISLLLGSDELLLADCKAYLCGLSVFTIASALQAMYQSFFVVAGKPNMGFVLSVISGVINAILDYVFMAIFGMGILGAAIATGIGQCVSAVAGTLFFLKRGKTLYFQRFRLHIKELINACTYGSAQMVTNISTSIITMTFNLVLMGLSGPDGVAAITVILYAQYLLSALYSGYSIGIAPILGFQRGKEDGTEIKRLYSMSKTIVLVSSLLVTVGAFCGAEVFVSIFVKPDTNPWKLGVEGFRIFATSYLFCGMNIFASGFFSAISDGKSSAIISFLRTFGFIMSALLILPKMIGIIGVWLAIPLAECLTIFVTAWLIKKKL